MCLRTDVQAKTAAVEGAIRNEEMGTFSTSFKASDKVRTASAPCFSLTPDRPETTGGAFGFAVAPLFFLSRAILPRTTTFTQGYHAVPFPLVERSSHAKLEREEIVGNAHAPRL